MEKITKLILLAVILCGANTIKGQVYINEILVNSAGINDGSNMPNTSEWIEFYNASASSVDVSCWFFTDGDFAVTFPSGTTIAAGGFLTVASAAGSGLSPTINWATCGCTSGPSSEVGIFTNGNEQIVLYNSSSTIVDAIIWGTGQLPGSMNTSALGSCSAKSITLPAAGVTYENIGSNGTDGVARERSYDGSSTWQAAGAGSFAGSNGINPLPIELINFSGVYSNGTVELNWQTATELNNDFYTIERSYDGVNFETLNTIKGKGNSSTISSYQIMDTSPLQGIAYYRLKQTDYDGLFAYSETIWIENKKELTMEIYPNPSNNGIFQLKSLPNESLTYKVVNYSGELVATDVIKADHLNINVSHLTKGLYFLFVITPTQQFQTKLIYN